jgi:DNA-binding NtrC family response regulator
VLPVASRGRVLGLLVLEVGRGAALGDPVRSRAQAELRALEPLAWVSAFRAALRARAGGDFAWDPRARFPARVEPALRLLAESAESSAPLVLFGPPGAGRRTLAGWLHFRARGDAEAAPPRLLELRGLARGAQLALARELERGAAERVYCLADAPPEDLRARGELEPELARVLAPRALGVPPLCDRRDEIPSLARVLGAARCAGFAARLSDEALAGLWRQDWRGNVAELATLVADLAELPGPIGRGELRAACAARRWSYRPRLASRRPRALDIELALATTRHRAGSWNRARAARYLGWTADTLTARLRECSLGPPRTDASEGG